MILFTIGHSNHTIDKFIRLLQDQAITVLVDVRTSPYSRHNPQFDKDHLEFELPRHGIRYEYAGKRLGGRPSDPTCYKSHALPAEGADFLHEVDYPEVMNRPWFAEGVEELLEIAEEETAVIMCSEEDPAACHRHHLIAKYILANYPETEVRHIRGDGTVYGARSILTSVDKSIPKQGTLF